MTFLISGGAKNGKSSLAQRIAVRVSDGGILYYVATMIPSDEEDKERIRRHIADRDGLGFQTLECGLDILSCLRESDCNATFLVDSTTALLANEMFRDGVIDQRAGARCAEELSRFANTVRNAVFVSDGIFSDAECYDEITDAFRKGLALIDLTLAGTCDTVIEMVAGQPVVLKGGLPE